MDKEPNATILFSHTFAQRENPVLVLRIRPDEPVSYEYGQSLCISVDGTERFYTPTWTTDCFEDITDNWKDGSELEFIIRMNRDGVLTPKLFALEKGTRIALGAAQGKVTQESLSFCEDPLVYVSTGSGQSQSILALNALLEGYPGKVLSIVAAKDPRGTPYHKVHSRLMQRYSNYQYLPLFDSEKDCTIQELFLDGADLLYSKTGVDVRFGAQVVLRGSKQFLFGDAKHKGAGDYRDVGMVPLLEQYDLCSGQNVQYEAHFIRKELW